jgi:hypothetical protein
MIAVHALEAGQMERYRSLFTGGFLSHREFDERNIGTSARNCTFAEYLSRLSVSNVRNRFATVLQNACSARNLTGRLYLAPVLARWQTIEPDFLHPFLFALLVLRPLHLDAVVAQHG